jgi:hypothetical protein
MNDHDNVVSEVYEISQNEPNTVGISRREKPNTCEILAHVTFLNTSLFTSGLKAKYVERYLHDGPKLRGSAKVRVIRGCVCCQVHPKNATVQFQNSSQINTVAQLLRGERSMVSGLRK